VFIKQLSEAVISCRAGSGLLNKHLREAIHVLHFKPNNCTYSLKAYYCCYYLSILRANTVDSSVHNLMVTALEAINIAIFFLKLKSYTYPHCFSKYIIYYIKKKINFIRNIEICAISITVFFSIIAK
jgi:hypothetical protein